MIGKTLVHYEITAEIGKGGMGEVYQAKDTKLGRDVAIKVLPEEFALDKDRVARFQREAKLLASLNHPNIAAIYGLEESEGTHFLVMELIEGDTLRDRIKSGPIPVEEALKLALQMAEGLEAAHEKGVIHRDLKPANIKVTPDGKVKILDFGLAKAYVGDQENMSPMDSPTISAAATQQGVILGTAAYMSPEQARGKPVDKKADIWAFGVVLFEMLTGKSLFSGEDVTSTVARVLEREPDFATLPQMLHPRIQFMLERCLKKELKDRYSSISDARVDVQEVLAKPGDIQVKTGTTVLPQKKLRTILPWVAAAIVVAGVVVWLLKPSPAPEPKQVLRSEYVLPEDQQFYRDQDGSIGLAVSTDGSQFAYSTTKGIYLRSMNELDARLITGTDEDAKTLMFSPDDRWIAYFSPSDQKVKKVSINGGKPIDLCDTTLISGPKWYKDDTIVYSDLLNGIYRISADGGEPELLVEGMTAVPRILPDGKSVMFTDLTISPRKVIVQSLESGERKVVFDEGSGSYSSPGFFWHGSENNQWLVASFDLDNLEITSGSFPAFDVMPIGANFSASGTLVYVPGIRSTVGDTSLTLKTLVWVDRKGKEETIEAKPDDYYSARVSPDGKKLAVVKRVSGNIDIYVFDISRKNMSKLTFNESIDADPLWSPDSKKIVFTSAREGVEGVVVLPNSLFWKNADGTGNAEKIFTGPPTTQIISPVSWTRDGKSIVTTDLKLTPFNADIGILSMDASREKSMLLQDKYNEIGGAISPDGKWMLYQSDESGKSEIYVRPFPDVDTGGKWQITNDGGNSPLWSPDGNELFYRNGDAAMVVPLETDPTFSPGNPEVLFRGDFLSSISPIPSTPWDIHPNSRQFLMIKEVSQKDEANAEPEADMPRKIIIVTNWFEELKQRVPVD